MRHLPVSSVCIYLVLFLVTSFFSWPQIMTTLAPYDDEGYVMMTLSTYLDGDRLYGETHTQYGPAFYQISRIGHQLLGIPITQNAVRCKTLIVWGVCTLLAFRILQTLGVRIGVSLLASLAFHLHLDKLALEPGHPQELLLLITMIVTWLMTIQSRWKWIAAACLASMAGMIKLNCGFIVAVPLLVSACFAPRGQGFCRWTPWIVCLVGGATTISLCALELFSGVSSQELLWGVLLQHRSFTDQFYNAPTVSWLAIGCSIVWTAAAFPRWIAYRSTVLKLSTVIFVVSAVLSLSFSVAVPLQHGLQPRGSATWMVWMAPSISMWLLVSGHSVQKESSFRVYLSILTCLSLLMIYPTPGTQVALATSIQWIAIAVLVNDAWGETLRRTASDCTIKSRMLFPKKELALVMTIGICASAFPWVRWISNTPLQLQGGELLRLTPDLVEREQAITKAVLDTGCRYLFFDGHNHNRFFFWTGLEPLSAANPTFWPRMLSDAEQQRIMTALENNGENVCVVMPPERHVLAGENAARMRSLVESHFRRTGRVGDWEIGVYSSTGFLPEAQTSK